MTPGATTYHLVPPPTTAAEPVALDAEQQRVVDHAGGPLLVLAGPGTGKTTTLVEAIADRIEQRGVDPSQILALTFSRKAAESLRDRVTARVGRTLADDLSRTFHSFAYGLVRAYAPAGVYDAPLRLLSAPEQDVVLQELLTHADESVAWPDALRQAVGTRGFAREVLDVLARAREKGLDGAALGRLGREHALPEFEAAGLFLEQYLTILDSLGAVDYPDLIRRAVVVAEQHRAALRARFTHVFVDEYQDTDPSQVRLLQALAGGGRELVVVGDPHQSIYGFRGADVGGILRFPTEFPAADGSPAEVVALRTTRRFGSRLLVATQRVAGRLAFTGSVPVAAQEAFARPRSEADVEGLTEVLTFDTDRAEAEHLADLLRRTHLEQGLPWSDMAVLVRSAQATLPALRRALGAAGVPVEVAADDTPLVREPAVVPLLSCLEAVLHGDETDPTAPTYLHPSAVADLLVSPLVELDATESGRWRGSCAARAQRDGEPPRPSADLVREAVLEPALLEGLDGEPVRRAAAFGRLVQQARRVLDDGGTAEDVLWSIWSATRWPSRLRARAASGGQSARLAHRDLDAVVALFEAASRSEQQHGHRSLREFTETLRAQQIPADTLAERGVRGDAVRLLTAHRSKGLEWPLVVVAHVQEEAWPDLRRRHTLLRADRIGVDDLLEPVSARAMLTEERRLFYVACTRARERLVVTAVASTDPDGEQPSRFLLELAGDAQRIGHRQGRPPRPLSLPGLVAELRRTLADPDADPGLRDAAARRLARLAGERDASDRALVAAADPATWWGTRALTLAETPIRPAEQPVVVSASTLAGLIECPAKWFLEREAGGASKTSQSQGFGNIAHALADRVAGASWTPAPTTSAC